MQPKTQSYFFWIYLLGISGMLALPLTLSSVRGAVANLAPATTPAYLPMFDTRLALTNSPLYSTNNHRLVFVDGNTNILFFQHTTAGKASISNPANYITIGPGQLVIQENANDNVFFNSGGAIAFVSGVAAGTWDSGRRFELNENVAATSSSAKNSQSIVWMGQGWSTNSGTTMYSKFGAYNEPHAGAVEPSGRWVLVSMQESTGVTTTNLTVVSNSGYTGTGANVLYDDGYFKAAPAGATFNPTSGYSPYNNAGSWADSWWYYTANGMGTDTNIYFGPGTTNALFRTNGTDLAYWNTGPQVAITAVNGSGDYVRLTANNGASAVLTPSNGALELQGSFYSRLMRPLVGDSYDIGANTSSGYYRNAFVGRMDVKGFGNENSGDYSLLRVSQSTTNDPVSLDSRTGGTAGYARGFSFKTNGVELLSVGLGGANKVIASGEIKATNGFYYQFKSTFSTNYTCTTNVQFYMLNGTNQLITLPLAANGIGHVYRFSCTNGYGSFVITNAADGATIRDGKSLSYTNIGINEVGFISDGSNWWLASKGKQIFPSASWSLTNNITPVQDVITNIPFTTLEFNNSQGINLLTNAGWTGATQLWVTNAGTYLITFSAVLKGSAGGSKICIWLRKDGSDVPRTRTDQAFSGATAQQCMTVNYFQQVGTSPSYFELVAASHDLSPPTIESAAPNPTGFTAPAMPGVIVTINRVSDTWP